MTAPCPSFGFVVTLELRAEIGASGRAQFWEAWIDFLGSRGLYSSGGGGDTRDYVVASEATQATDADRVAILDWLGGRGEPRAYRVGELIDLSQAV
jgi:uncharacterized protein YggL (DUF469 family)